MQFLLGEKVLAVMGRIDGSLKDYEASVDAYMNDVNTSKAILENEQKKLDKIEAIQNP